MRDVLEERGYSTEAAGNAIKHWRCWKGTGYEAVLTDIEMPGEPNGLDLAWTIEVKWPQIGVVVTSRKYLPAPKNLPLTARFVAKPVQADVLLQAVGQASTPPQRPSLQLGSIHGAR